MRALLATLLLALAGPARAADWLVIQGTEEGRKDEALDVGGFLQAGLEVGVRGEPVTGLSEALAAHEGERPVFDLAPIEDRMLIPQQILLALNAGERPGIPVMEQIAGAIESRPILLVLDNCEHQVDACAGIVESLLQTCPRLSVVATSREALGVMGETVGVTEEAKRAVVDLYERLTSVRAVRSSRVHAVASDIYVVPGPRVVDAAWAFLQMLHPEAVEGSARSRR